MTAERPRRLGRGLEALISGAVRAVPQPADNAAAGSDQPRDPYAPEPTTPGHAQPDRIPIASIRANPFQPRKEFKPEDLAELQDSIRANGLLQPITVRTAPDGNGYELAAGERRLRAVTNLGWTDVPALVREFNDRELLAVALVENLQRADLNPIEEAEGYARLVREFSLTQQQVAEIVGKDRSTVANMLRILNLPSSVRTLLLAGSLSMGHARALLTIGDDEAIQALAAEISEQGLSVREVERRARVRKPTPEPVSDSRTPAADKTDSTAQSIASKAHLRRIEDQLRKHLQTDARINLTGADKGHIAISFYSPDDLDRLLDIIIGAGRDYR